MIKRDKNLIIALAIIALLGGINVVKHSNAQDYNAVLDKNSVPEHIEPSGLDVSDAFLQADVIPDGKIDAGEFDIYHYNIFNFLDLDQDNHLSKEECLNNCFSAEFIGGDKGKKAKYYQKLEFSKAPYRYNDIDIDGSGDLVVYEYILYGRERFEAFDFNNDKRIENQEFCDGYQVFATCKTLNIGH